MKRNKTPDYRGQHVFGVPPLIHVQRTGQPLPQSIQQAMRYLRRHCLDQVSAHGERVERKDGAGRKCKAKKLGTGAAPVLLLPPGWVCPAGTFLLASGRSSKDGNKATFR